VKTSELTGPALDWAVATAEKMSWWTLRTADWDSNLGYTDWVLDRDGVLKKFVFDGSRSRAGYWAEHESFMPSTDWSQGGPIIEREKISSEHKFFPEGWECRNGRNAFNRGPTPLIAAMRCFVASKLGDEVDVPEELIS
jgi:hypothetical protein